MKKTTTKNMFALAALVCLIAACAVPAPGEPPPVEFSARESLMGAGMILQVKNTSAEPLNKLELQITAPSGEQRSFTTEQLEAHGAIEVGWKKLDGWKIPPESEVSLRCEGFSLPLEATVPAAGTATATGS